MTNDDVTLRITYASLTVGRTVIHGVTCPPERVSDRIHEILRDGLEITMDGHLYNRGGEHWPDLFLYRTSDVASRAVSAHTWIAPHRILEIEWYEDRVAGEDEPVINNNALPGARQLSSYRPR